MVAPCPVLAKIPQGVAGRGGHDVAHCFRLGCMCSRRSFLVPRWLTVFVLSVKYETGTSVSPNSSRRAVQLCRPVFPVFQEVVGLTGVEFLDERCVGFIQISAVSVCSTLDTIQGCRAADVTAGIGTLGTFSIALLAARSAGLPARYTGHHLLPSHHAAVKSHLVVGIRLATAPHM